VGLAWSGQCKSNGMILEGARAIWYGVRDCVANPSGYCPDLILRKMVCAALEPRGGWSGWSPKSARLEVGLALFTCVTAVARVKSVGYHVR
jgi:hypothetical protein